MLAAGRGFLTPGVPSVPARNDLAIRYHDEEWGVPVHDDRRWFEFLILEGAQAGLSWDTILRKREAYRRAFAGFDPDAVARFDEARSSRSWPTPASCGTGSRSPRRSRMPGPSWGCGRSSAASTPTSGGSLTVARSGTPGEGWFGPKFPEDVDELHFQVVGVIKDVERLKALFDLFAAVLDQLCRIGSAYKQEPGIEV